MSVNARNSVLTSSVFLLAFTSIAYAQDQDFDTNGDIIGVVVGAGRVGFNTTSAITVIANDGTDVGTSLSSSPNLSTYNNSTLNMSGGRVRNSLLSFGDSVVNFSGGRVEQGIGVGQNSIFNFSGGFGGYEFVTSENGVANFSGGRVAFDGRAEGNSVFNITGGEIGATLSARGKGVINISGGNIVTMDGGGILISENSSANIRGGNFGGDFQVANSGVLSFFGSSLTTSLLSEDNQYKTYELFGFLSDGADITGRKVLLDNNGLASLRLVNAGVAAPEPGSLALFGLALPLAGMAAMGRRRRLS